MPVLAVKAPWSGRRVDGDPAKDDDDRCNMSGPRKMLRLDPSCVVAGVPPHRADPEAAANQPKPCGFDAVSSDSLQRVLQFLSMRDRFALLRTQRRLLQEPLAREFSSRCGRCDACASSASTAIDSRMDEPSRCCTAPIWSPRDRSFWQCLLRYSGSTGLQALRLDGASCSLFADVLRSSAPAQLASALTALRVLGVRCCNAFGQQGLSAMAQHCTYLQELRLCGMSLDCDALSDLIRANATTLQLVDLTDCHVLTSQAAISLAQCPQLQSLSLAGCFNVANATLIQIVSACRQLKVLNLRFCHRVDDTVVTAIAATLDKLEQLDLRYCARLTNASVDAICIKLRALQSLNLSQCSRITDAAVLRIALHMQALRELHLWGCTKLTVVGVSAISDGLPSLMLVDIRSRDRSEQVIGGKASIRLLSQSRRRMHAKWEPCDQLGVFKRMPLCVAMAC